MEPQRNGSKLSEPSELYAAELISSLVQSMASFPEEYMSASSHACKMIILSQGGNTSMTEGKYSMLE